MTLEDIPNEIDRLDFWQIICEEGKSPEDHFIRSVLAGWAEYRHNIRVHPEQGSCDCRPEEYEAFQAAREAARVAEHAKRTAAQLRWVRGERRTGRRTQEWCDDYERKLRL